MPRPLGVAIGLPRVHQKLLEAPVLLRVNRRLNLGIMYSRGDSVPQDYVRAHMWLNLAAAQGEEKALKARDLIAKQMTPADISKARPR